MGKLSKIKCENCGVNVEFDASRLYPGESRKVPCPSCGADILCINSTPRKKLRKDVGLNLSALSTQSVKPGFQEDDPIRRFRDTKRRSRILKSPTGEHSAKRFGISRGVVALWFLAILTFGPWLTCFLAIMLDCNLFDDQKYGQMSVGAVILAGCGFSVITGLFLLFLFFDVEKRKCPNCGKWGALRDTGSSSVVSSTDATEKELRNAFIGQQLGRPEEMITYLQDVKVKKHTTVATSRCVFCDYETDFYDSYTTKS